MNSIHGRSTTLQRETVFIQMVTIYGQEVVEEQKYVKNIRTVNTDLPMYVTRLRKDGVTIGYGVRRHPKLTRAVDFVSKNNVDEMYNKAIECLNYLNSLGNDELDQRYNTPKPVGGQRVNTFSEELPKYISPTKNRKGEYTGFKVSTYKENEPTKYFRVKGDDNLKNAMDYLTELMQKRMQIRE